MTALTVQTYWDALRGVADPEIPVVNIVEMGMVRAIDIVEHSEIGESGVRVRFTPTFSGCPALHVIRQGITDALAAAGADAVTVENVFSPPWTTDDITPEARAKLETYGIAPPASNGESSLFMTLEPEAVRCPRCGSFDTRMTASFGSALCKRMYVCQACREPFEGMKSV
jgi:ring-1,2-phenylacetyl-CoA epoxidase subunit PaaD